MKKKLSIFDTLNTIALAIITVLTILPVVTVVTVSLSDETSIARNGFQLIPEKWSLQAYKVLASGTTLLNAYGVSVFLTIVGTVGAVAITAMMAYALSRKCLRYRNALNMIVYIPMVFSGGLVPFYITLLKLGLKDTLVGLIIPMIFNPFNFFLMLNFFRGLPDAVVEAAKIDGAGEFRIFRSIMLFLALPGLATITLFYAINYWNDWTLALYLISEQELYPLQYLLRQVMMRVTIVSGMQSYSGAIPAESTKMATVVATVGPIVLVYPFVQKYFIKGITIGSVKG